MAVASQKITDTKFLDLMRGAFTAAPTTVGVFCYHCSTIIRFFRILFIE